MLHGFRVVAVVKPGLSCSPPPVRETCCGVTQTEENLSHVYLAPSWSTGAAGLRISRITVRLARVDPQNTSKLAEVWIFGTPEVRNLIGRNKTPGAGRLRAEAGRDPR